MKEVSRVESHAFYRVITDSFLHDDRVYNRHDLIPREGGTLDYALGIGLIEIYKPEGELKPLKSRSSSALARFLAKLNPRANV